MDSDYQRHDGLIHRRGRRGHREWLIDAHFSNELTLLDRHYLLLGNGET